MNEKETAFAKQLAKEHWEYLCKVLETHGVSAEERNIIGFHYKTAGIHFFKHGIEYIKDQLKENKSIAIDDEYFKTLMNDRVGGSSE